MIADISSILQTYRMELTEDADGSGYVAFFPELKGYMTCGNTAEQATKAVKDAKRAWLAAAIEDGYPIPAPESGCTFKEVLGQLVLAGESRSKI